MLAIDNINRKAKALVAMQSKRVQVIAAVIFCSVLGSVTALALVAPDGGVPSEQDEYAKGASSMIRDMQKKPAEGSASTDATHHKLVRLIELEKVAYDLTVRFDQRYPKNVFAESLKEATLMQGRLTKIIVSNGIKDPRSSLVGTFDDPAIQKLYDEQKSAGEKSHKAAASALIEVQTRIVKQLSEQLTTASDTDLIASLEALRRGSENQLRILDSSAE